MRDLMIGSKVIISTDNFFFGRDGKQYRSVWGGVLDIMDSESTLGVKTNAKSTNWYVNISGVIIAGCQIHYCVLCPEKPPEFVEDWKDFDMDGDTKIIKFMRPSLIYIA